MLVGVKILALVAPEFLKRCFTWCCFHVCLEEKKLMVQKILSLID